MWIIAVIAALAMLLLIILLMPVEIIFHANLDDKKSFRIRFSWLSGLVTKELTRGERKPKAGEKAVH